MKRSVYLLFVIVINASLCAAPSQKANAATALYASSTGSDMAACTWDDPCSLQHATAIAESDAVIWATTGNYTVDSGNEVLFIDKGMTIIGGCNETFTQCKPNTIPATYLDGEDERRVITIKTASKSTTINLRNLTIAHGNATGINLGDCPVFGTSPTFPPMGCGGGIFAKTVGTLFIEDSHLTYNNASMAITDNGYGGAACISDTNFVYFDHNQVSHNTAGVNNLGLGGGLYITGIGVNSNLSDNSFSQNDCTMVNASSMGCHAMFYDNAFIHLTDNHFEAGNSQDALAIKGSALAFLENDQFFLTHNEFLGQKGSSVVFSTHEDTNYTSYIRRNTFWLNDTRDLVVVSGALPIEISNNFMGHSGPIGRQSPERAETTTAISLSSTFSAEIYFNTIAKIDQGISAITGTSIFVKNNIFAYLTGAGISSTGTKTIDRNLFYQFVGGFTGTNALIGTYNPQLADPNNGDFHLLPTSAAINMSLEGLSFTEDIDGEIRPIGISDLGADEYMLNRFMPLLFR